MDNKEVIYQTVDLHKSFGELNVLNGIDLDIHKGEVVVILGPSGCGKSTYLRCLNLLENVTSGKIYFEGNDITSKGVNVNKLRSKVGMVFQQFNLFPHMNALKNVMVAQQRVLKRSKEEAKENALRNLDVVGMKGRANYLPSQLSGGQQQRVAIARALAMDPHVILFDEATSALDPELVREVLQVMKELAQSGMTMVVVTHEMQFARDVGDTIVLLNDGKIEEKASAYEFFNNPKSQITKDFLGHYSE
ncbi:MAG: amino acid ABC transporter ATP-binding protein [Coriobacteriales bacterium]|nr:amino acid ABC transporter ATP-binding protein [Coriobacteriales bacterium]